MSDLSTARIITVVEKLTVESILTNVRIDSGCELSDTKMGGCGELERRGSRR